MQKARTEMSAYVGICSSLCSRDALFADTFCGTRHLLGCAQTRMVFGSSSRITPAYFAVWATVKARLGSWNAKNPYGWVLWSVC